MKKQILMLSLLFIFTGCAQTRFNDSVVRQSEPIFVDTKPKNSKAYIRFINSSNFESNLMDILNHKLIQNGYEVVHSKKNASLLIDLNLNYFRRNRVVDTRPTIGFGIGRGSGSWGYGFGMESSNNDYFYDAQLSLKISIDDGKKEQNYMTNLDYQNTKGYNSIKILQDDFDERISNQILRYLKDYQ
ncbi:putative TraT complement resistance protein [Campylobacter blaseri]|uniref:DUF4136 domain-containing protein n=1 Tax=Campylobacter blaseri TaxID=2042961 RepID=A0A2P8R464_9BACT|nr:complement resistance protein TraT [Campylobacter blaseri]PSM53269.1 hypothetical protein CQ405_01625 [Campylobacter blaseri]PSM54735.1 hypothetical protein CRN67_01625 [Campylobacter blaseri]QKF86783.1 putative TraT complement resistance protein [Campylobacter blaseri]